MYWFQVLWTKDASKGCRTVADCHSCWFVIPYFHTEGLCYDSLKRFRSIDFPTQVNQINDLIFKGFSKFKNVTFAASPASVPYKMREK